MTQQFSQYHRIVSGLARQALSSVPPASPAADSVAMGVVPAKLLLDDDRSLYDAMLVNFHTLARLGEEHAPASTQGIAGIPGSDRRPVMLKDAMGHSRDVYHPLIVHLHLAAFGHRYESLPVNIWGACEESIAPMIAPLRSVEDFVTGEASEASVALALWQALCIAEQAVLLSRDVDLELVDALVHRIISQPGPDGSLHVQSPDAALDTWTYNELCGLHALANLALLRRNNNWSRRVEQVAVHHLNNTQPDYTTTQPWAVFAFVWSGKARSFADQQLLDAANHHQSISEDRGSSRNSPVSLLSGLLLTDAAYALAKFI